jgi:hypothetical protein
MSIFVAMVKGITQALAVIVLLSAKSSFAAPADISGNWLGTLEVEQTKLRLLFKIIKTPEGAWSAALDSLDQGVKDIPVEGVKVQDNKLHLEVKMLKGVYEGELDSNANKVTGKWMQTGESLPLTLEKTKGQITASDSEPLSPADLAASKVAAQKLGGNWNGTLISGAAQISLSLSISTNKEGAATGTMASPEQGLKDIPISSITYSTNGQTHFAARGLGATYDGVSFNSTTSMTGQWHQAGQNLPLNFRKSGSK